MRDLELLRMMARRKGVKLDSCGVGKSELVVMEDTQLSAFSRFDFHKVTETEKVAAHVRA